MLVCCIFALENCNLIIAYVKLLFFSHEKGSSQRILELKQGAGDEGKPTL